MKEPQDSADPTQQHSEQGSGMPRERNYELGSSEPLVATAVRGAGNRPDTDAPASRRDDISLQGTATSAAAAREAGGGVAMGAVLPQLIDIAASNLAFLTAMEAAAAS
ncbi:hypothetical protein BDDG_12259 [Blastomyces dermatitidis ATCC 18188]|uniref:Uncharacterized protein n=1 Tax=Ajellomyces dermatitidis (strain ATCC 18188 / CBS 674.68) TaxID=653446 RepID=A0A0J9ERA4_AJEDA|nr:hypothetical protein BDDG_12259 [Blastomyces dermatitidis ATCC 18188]